MFVTQASLTWRLAVDLLDKLNNPDNHQPYSEADDDDLEVRPRLPKPCSGLLKAADVCVCFRCARW